MPEPTDTDRETTPAPVEDICERCGAMKLVWRNCKLICTNCRAIVKSCADL
jgi:hypothetical protein